MGALFDRYRARGGRPALARSSSGQPFGLAGGRRLRVEPLEVRCLLSVAAPQVALFNTCPALFVENLGQWEDEGVRFVHQGDGANVLHTDAGPVIELFERTAPEPDAAAAEPGDPPEPPAGQPGAEDVGARTDRVAVSFDGANRVTPVGLQPAETEFSFFVGDPSQWRSRVPSYEIVAYENLYHGIDLHTWGQRDSLKYEFHVAPGADYEQILISYRGIEGLWVDDAGALHVETALGELVDDAPYVYQMIDGREVDVPGRFELIDADTYSFVLEGDYDPGRELVVDPDVEWATYLGADNYDHGRDVALDAEGNVYVTGSTRSAGWATSGAFDTTYNGWNDAFVAKLNPTGSQLLYCTYLGGDLDDYGWSIVLDDEGSVYVAGSTRSADWATPGAFDTTHNGGWDAFVAKLDPTGANLEYCTYLGGANQDDAYGIAIDAAGNAYVTGWTDSPGWATPDAYNPDHIGAMDIFVAKLNPDGSDLTYCTYLGSFAPDLGDAVAIDELGNAYVTGWTESRSWVSPAGSNSVQAGLRDAFVACVDSTGSNLLSLRFLGGSEDDEGAGIAVDSQGYVFVTGRTQSTGLATTGAYDTTHNGGWDVFAAKLYPGAYILDYLTYLGGAEWDEGTDLAIDSDGYAYVTGRTSSPQWSVGEQSVSSHQGGFDAFVAKLHPQGVTLFYATLLGGTGHEGSLGIALDADRNAYVAGYTYSSDWATPGAYDESHNGGTDVFVAKVSGAAVVGRHVFYNDSAWDASPGSPGGDPAPNQYDDNAIAPDPDTASSPELGKTPLLPGQTATFQNYTSYSKGLNGIMVDIARLPGTPTRSDFMICVGNDNNPDDWPLGPLPTSITVRPGAGVGLSDRVTLIWPNHDPLHPGTTAVRNQWMQVTVLPTANTGLVEPEVFYWGNAVGDSGLGNTESYALVNAVDSGAVRDNAHNPYVNPAPLDDFADYNRDRWVNAVDFGLVRDNATPPTTALMLIGGGAVFSPVVGFGAGATGGEGGPVVTVDNPFDFWALAESPGPMTIEVQGVLDVGQIWVESDKTIVGDGDDGLVGELFLYGVQNVIIQNLYVTNPYGWGSGDAISLYGAEHVWIDHVDVFDAPDGLIDITAGSDFVTVSWSKLYYTPADPPSHNFAMLIGASDTDTRDVGKEHITIHHNWWGDDVVERMPRVRFGDVHVFNNYFNSPGNNYCVRAAIESELLVENNYFEDVNDPHVVYITTGTPGQIEASGNVYVNTTGGRDDGDVVFTPPYAYPLDDGFMVRDIVTAGAGVQTVSPLGGLSQLAPVAQSTIASPAPNESAVLHDAAVAELGTPSDALAGAAPYTPGLSWLAGSDASPPRGRSPEIAKPPRTAVEELLATL